MQLLQYKDFSGGTSGALMVTFGATLSLLFKWATVLTLFFTILLGNSDLKSQNSDFKGAIGALILCDGGRPILHPEESIFGKFVIIPFKP